MRIRVIGIGCGDPGQLTLEAVAALRTVDVFVAAEKGPEDPLLRTRERICERHVGDGYRLVSVRDPERDRGDGVTSADGYRLAVDAWHQARAQAYSDALAAVEPRATVGFMVWGDPAFYDSTIRILERVRAIGEITFTYDVLPGISAVQLLAARHHLVLNDVGTPITMTTGRRLRSAVDHGADNLVVVLNRRLDAVDLDGTWNIWWGGNLGTEGELLVAGTVADVADEIAAARADLRADQGWVMDTYLLRRGSAGSGQTVAGSHTDV
ncbi:MAG: precorrin-6A synthase (deacetylating) [Nocardioidaceae bacterium]